MIDFHVHIGRDYWADRHKPLVTDRPYPLQIEQVLMGTDINRYPPFQIEDLPVYWFQWIDPRDKEDLLSLEVFISKDKISGLKHHPSTSQVDILDRRLEPYISLCQRYDLPMLVHCGSWQLYSKSDFLVKATERNPDVTFIMAHMGGKYRMLQYNTLELLDKTCPDNLYLETSGCYVPWFIDRAVDIVGNDRVLFGSDYPWYDPILGRSVIDKTELNDKDRELILDKNARRMLI